MLADEVCSSDTTCRVLDDGNSVEELIVGLLAPTQREIGLLWQTHRWNTQLRLDMVAAVISMG